jgi:EPS-associated MarR family transcriptional regulator
MLDKEVHLQLLRELERNPEITQRQLAKQLDVSLGKANYCLSALIEKGLVKAKNFKNNENKRAYLYVLTPKGIDEKSRITVKFLKRKLSEYELLKREIEQLKSEVNRQGSDELG